MKKTIALFLTVLLLLPICSITAGAEDVSPSFSFVLSVDGKEIKEVQPGDIITVVLKLCRTDTAEPYTMYAMQDEIRYDSSFLEIVEDSAVLGNGIFSTDIAMVDEYREFYMNYLSMSGGTEWEAETIVGSFQLRVIGESGVTQITSQDYKVSYRDGSGSYDCDANGVTIVLSTDCTIRFMSSGGSEIESQKVPYGERINRPVDPIREGYEFAGWYKDIHLTDEWNFESDYVQGNMTLYARWILSNNVESETTNRRLCGWWLLIVLLLLVLYIIKRIKDKKKRRE